MAIRFDHAIVKTRVTPKPRVGGLVGVFATLAKQHGELASLFETVRHDRARRGEEDWPKIRHALLTHERAEMRVLYPELRMRDQLRPLANRHDAEASELERMIHDLDEVEMTSDTWRNLFERLADTVVHHAREEEHEIFPLAQRVIGKDRAKELDAKFQNAQRSLEHSA